MADVANTLRYRTGTATVTQGSKIVTGQNTRWASAGINPGGNFYIDGNAYPNEIKSVDSDTQITLVKPYTGASASLQSYSIDRYFQSTPNAAIVARQAALLTEFEAIRDGNVITITGKDAYEVYQEEGGTKTRAQFKNVFDANELAVDKLERLEPYLIHRAGIGNAHFRGNELSFDESIIAAIQGGKFGGTYGGKFVDIYPGDYFTFQNVDYSYTDENNKTQSDTYTGTMRVLDLDYFLNCGDHYFVTHHIVVAPDNILFSANMNDENTTDGGYIGTKMRTVHLKRAEAIFKACFGASHIISHREYLVNAVTNGKPTGGAWIDSAVDLMDERMVDGSCIYDSGNSDGTTVPNRNSIASSQFAAFRYDHKLFRNAENYWLRNVVSGTNFAVINHFGASANANASNVFGVRPYALVS